MAKDYYKTLGVARNASQAEIQKAYRELAREYHPDRNPDDKTAKGKFIEVQAAFDVLNDSKKREMYDRYGSAFETMGAGGPQGGGQWGPGMGGGFGTEGIDLSDILGAAFGGGGGGVDLGDLFGRSGGGQTRAGHARRPRRGADVRSDVQVPFTTAILGGDLPLELQLPSGHVRKISVGIPAGIDDGKTLRIPGQGEEYPAGGDPGDILLTVRVMSHPCFQRRGNHLHVKVPVTLSEAVSGAKVDVPTPLGTVTLSIPPGTSSGAKLRIKGHGVPAKAAGASGDLLAEIQIVLPREIDQPTRETIQNLNLPYSEDPRTSLQW